MQKLVWSFVGAITLVVVVAAAGLIFLRTGANGFSARAQPSAMERLVARRTRAMASPAGARERRNPVVESPEILAEARAHWADHCATCHANNGSGETEIVPTANPISAANKASASCTFRRELGTIPDPTGEACPVASLQ